MNLTAVYTMIVYLVCMVAFGIYFSRSKYTASAADYFAGKVTGVGPFVLAFTILATQYSAGSYMSEVGWTYEIGYSTFWLGAMSLTGILAEYLLVGRRYYVLGRRLGLVTPGDLLAERYYSPATVRALQAIIMVVCMVGYLVAQFKAMGIVFNVMVGIPFNYGVILGVGICTLYTALGGYLAVAWTDFVQGCIMVFAAIAVPIACMVKFGGLTSLNAQLAAMDPRAVSFGGAMSFPLWLMFLVAFNFGVLGYPLDLPRWFSLRRRSMLLPSMFAGLFFAFVVHFGTKIIGLYAKVHVAGIADPDMTFAQMTTMLLNPVVAGVVLCALVGACMSTVDSLLLSATAAIGNDIWRRIINPKLSEQEAVRSGRIIVVICALVSIVLAFKPMGAIVWIAMFAWGGLALAFTPPLVLGIYWPRATREGAVAGMAIGFLVAMLWYVLKHPLGVHGIVMGMAVNAAVLVLVSMVTPKPPKEVVANFFPSADELASIE